LVVQLQNGQAAVLRKVADEAVRGRGRQRVAWRPCCSGRLRVDARSFLTHALPAHISSQQVLIDCNHPLAGAPLTFTLLVLALEPGVGAGGAGLEGAL
jgi:hypothetical protein